MMHTFFDRRRTNRGPSSQQRGGVIIVLTAFLLVFLLGMIAFAVDLGMIANTRAELQMAVDAAAYAGAGGLVTGTATATTEANSYYTKNRAGGSQLTSSSATLVFGNWDTNTRTFTTPSS